MNECDYGGCEGEAEWNVSDARGTWVGCYKVCTEHARGIVGDKAFGAIWQRVWDRYWLTPAGEAAEEVKA